jgi:hypothetical protein
VFISSYLARILASISSVFMVATNSDTVVGKVDMAPVPIVTVLNQIQHEEVVVGRRKKD